MLKTPPLSLCGPFGPAPLRRLHSIRRTSSLDFTWPGGRGTACHVEGTGRDLYTPGHVDEPRVLSIDRLAATLSTEQLIESISCEPPREGIERLLGCHRAGQLRLVFNESLPAERKAGTPLHLLVDDLPGASLVASWAWSRWCGKGPAPMYQPTIIEIHKRDERLKSMAGVCVGHRVGVRTTPEFDNGIDPTRQVVALANPVDTQGWHAVPGTTEPSMRRARRIDVWMDGDIHVDGMFQDSATTPDGTRRAVHEYSFQATVDPATLVLLSVEAQPRVLPFPECPEAVENLARLVGSPISEFRRLVPEKLRREKGCTHLNDAMRGMADVALIANRLAGLASSARPQA